MQEGAAGATTGSIVQSPHDSKHVICRIDFAECWRIEKLGSLIPSTHALNPAYAEALEFFPYVGYDIKNV